MKKISAAPYIHDRNSSLLYPLILAFTAIPALAWGIVMSGLLALIPVISAIFGALLVSWIVNRIRHEAHWDWPYALVSGLFIAMLMPATVPWFVPLIASVAGLGLAYLIIGPSGCAWINPSALGALIAMVSWPEFFKPEAGSMSYIGRWLNFKSFNIIDGIRPSEMISAFAPEHLVGPGQHIRDFMTDRLMVNSPAELFDLFLGFVQGPIGTISAVLLLLGSVVLFATRIADWRVATAAFSSFTLVALGLGGLFLGTGLGRGDVMFFIANGSFLFVLIYLSSIHSTLPLSFKGRIIYGIVFGLLLFIVAYFGKGDIGLLVALLVVNILVPFIDRVSRRSGQIRGLKV